MKIRIKVTETNGEAYEVVTNLFTIVALERKFKIRATELSTGIAMEHLAFLAYESCRMCNIPVPVSFDEYIKRIDSLDVIGEQDVNPTDGAVTDEP